MTWCLLIFPWTVWCLRDLKVAHSSGFGDHFPHVSLFTKCDDVAKMVLVRCCFWRTGFWPFRSIATSSFDRIYPGSKHFVGSGCWPNCVSLCCVRRVSLTVPNHLDSCSTFHKADVTSHVVSWFYVLDPSQAHTPNMESGSPLKRLMLAGGVFLNTQDYYQ